MFHLNLWPMGGSNPHDSDVRCICHIAAPNLIVITKLQRDGIPVDLNSSDTAFIAGALKRKLGLSSLPTITYQLEQSYVDL